MFKWGKKKDDKAAANAVNNAFTSYAASPATVPYPLNTQPQAFDSLSNYSSSGRTSNQSHSLYLSQSPQSYGTLPFSSSHSQQPYPSQDLFPKPRLILPSDLPGNPGHIAWVCRDSKSTHDFFISNCAVDPDRLVCRTLASMLSSLATYPPSGENVHVWFSQTCAGGSYVSPEQQVRNLKEAMLKSKVVVLFITDRAVELIKGLGAGESVVASSMLLELIICPIFVGREDFSIGASFKFTSYDAAQIPNVYHLHPASVAKGTMRDTLTSIFAFNGPSIMPDQMELEWHDMAGLLLPSTTSSLVSPNFVPGSALPIPSGLPTILSPTSRSTPSLKNIAIEQPNSQRSPGTPVTPLTSTESFSRHAPQDSSIVKSLNQLESFNRGAPLETGLSRIMSQPKASQKNLLQSKFAPQSKIAPSSHSGLIKRQFTWITLDEAIVNGEKLIVGAGRFVYDISTWINSHPGGSVILYGVLGTDVTQDFFNEATDFDKDSFFPQKAAPLQPIHKSSFRTPNWNTSTPSIYSVASVDTLDSTLDKHALLAKELRGNVFTTDDWEYVLKARRIHGHSQQGMAKIANLLVGEIIPSQEAIVKAATLS
ncbi:hypothetical protein HK096_005824, partial [Nowakowskiella sp. JEL0078]